MRYQGSVVVLLSLLMTGCTGPEVDSAGPEDPGNPATLDPRGAEVAAELPEWRIGQGWRYVMDIPGQPTRSFPMVVAEDHDDLWVIATTDPDLAFSQVLHGTNPMLGRNHKGTLSPYQGGESVEMFSFPLADSKRWEGRFFGQDTWFLSEYAGDIALQEGVGLGSHAQGFRITATGADGTRVNYDYVEAAQWFTSFEILDTEGDRLLRLDLVEIIDAYEGSYQFHRREPLLLHRLEATASSPVVEQVAIPLPERFRDGIVIGALYTGTQGTVTSLANVSLKGPPGEVPLDATYAQAGWTGPGQAYLVQDIDVDPSCLDAGDPSCDGAFRFDVALLGETQIELMVAAYQTFAEGVL